MYRRTRLHDFKMTRNQVSEGVYGNTIVIDNTEYRKVANGINIVVYDTLTEKIIDSFGFNSEDANNPVR